MARRALISGATGYGANVMRLCSWYQRAQDEQAHFEYRKAWSYDAAGNQTQKGSSTLAITYGDRGQTTQIGSTPQNYFGQGNTERINSGSAISYTASPLGLASRSGSSIGNESFVRDSRGNLVSWRQGTTAHYYITDSLGSVVGMFSSNGGFEGGYSYSPYGEARSTSTNASAVANVMRYIGSPIDSSGLYKLGARYYDPATGRFAQYDPSGQEPNPYAYAACNPVSAKDPSGLDCEEGADTAGDVLGAISFGAGVAGVVAGAVAAPVTGGASLAAGIAGAAGAVSIATGAPAVLISVLC